MREARDAYLAENGFSVDTYDDPTVRVSFFWLNFVVPNPPTRKRAVRVHDLHHVVTGYGTDIVGEAEVSAWEARRGFRGLGLYPSFLVTGVLAMGFLLAPRRITRAWRRGAGEKSLFRGDRAYEGLLDMTLGELRSSLGVDPNGVAVLPRKTHPLAPDPRGTVAPSASKESA